MVPNLINKVTAPKAPQKEAIALTDPGPVSMSVALCIRPKVKTYKSSQQINSCCRHILSVSSW